MLPLPDEIWLHVAHFLPALVLQELISVNRIFFELAMNSRYRQMSFAYFDNRMLRSLARLKDPLVAKRVRILHVYPGFLKEALEKEKHGPAPLLRRSLRDKLADIANLLLEQKKVAKHPRIRLIRTLKRVEDVVQIMLEVLSGLPNVTDYYVTWFGMPSITATAVPFLATVFQSNLRKLSLDLSLRNMRNLLTPEFKIDNLQELHLTIHSENISDTHIDNHERDNILITHLAPAISRLRATLRSLTIESWEADDLSAVLRQCSLPNTRLLSLEQLVVAIPVGTPHLGDPRGLAQFLTAHRLTLRTLCLRASQIGGAGLTPDPVSFDAFIRTAIAGVHLPKLRTLDINSYLFPVYTSLLCLSHGFAPGVTSLELTGCYRTYDDVEQALEVILAGREQQQALKRLRLGLVSLSPQLIDLIYDRLPNLKRLELIAKFILPHAYDAPQIYPSSPSFETGLGTNQIEEFITVMQDKLYPDWQLEHMSVVADFLPMRPTYDVFLEQAFMCCIPSLRTFS